jgi:queuosine precursor transporter
MEITSEFPSNPRKQYRWILLIAMIYLVGWLTSYPMIYKMTEVGNILEPGCIYLFPLSYAVADIVTEVYGYQTARKMVWFAIFSGFIFCLAIYLVVHVPGPDYWPNQQAYDVVFGHILRAYLATTVASFVGNFLNIFFISKFKVLMLGKYFWLRSIASTALGEFTFSVVGGTMAYAGVEPWSKIIYLMLDGYLFKMVYALIAVFPAALLVKWLKSSEKLDVYDAGIDYSPFAIKD